MEKVIVNSNNLHYLENFLANAGKTLDSFRYYQKRAMTITQNHLLTILLLDKNEPIVYGHLDPEDDKVWLGLAVTEKRQGQGFGKKMMQELMNFAEDHRLEKIHLSVDNDNAPAIHLYKKFGFQLVKILDKHSLYVRNR